MIIRSGCIEEINIKLNQKIQVGISAAKKLRPKTCKPQVKSKERICEAKEKKKM